MKTCIKCSQEKPLTEFHNRKSAKDGKQSQCKKCNIDRVKKWQSENPEQHKENWQRHTKNKDATVYKARKYDISVDDLNVLFDNAAGKCEICKGSATRWLVVDHCHDSTKVRGVLCEKCNTALGLFGDNIESLKSAIQYLNKEPLEYEKYQSLPRRNLQGSV